MMSSLITPFFLSLSASLSDEEEIIYDYPMERILEGHLTDYEVVIPSFSEGNRKRAIARMISSGIVYCPINTNKAAMEFVTYLEEFGVHALEWMET